MSSRYRAMILRVAAFGSLILLVACNTQVYVRDGVTDGDRFSLPAHVYADNDPVLQSWVAYSLSRSVCQLEIGGPNPARNSSFACELTAREALTERWDELGDGDTAKDEYLDALRAAADAGFLPEYVWHYLRRSEWEADDGLSMAAFETWRRHHLGSHHTAYTRIVGSWGYRSG